MYHRAQACEWDNYEADQEKLVDMARRGFAFRRFNLLSTPASASDQLICAQHWVKSIGPRGKPSLTISPSLGENEFVLAICLEIFISTPRRS